MTSRKRNEWLETDLSDEEEVGYDSEAAEERKGARAGVIRSSKRRKLDDDGESEPDEGSERESDLERVDGSNHTAAEEKDSKLDGSVSTKQTGSQQLDRDDLLESSESRPLTAAQLAASQKAARKTGVIYLSRIPPFMKPQTLRHLLQRFGKINRIFLSPEDPAAHTRRVRLGGNKKKSYTDGWVEFVSKKDAKMVAETLNTQIIGGKKGGWYHDDVWNIKYLKGFKWHHLTDQIANENAERAARLRADISQSRKEDKLFVQNVEKAKMLEGIKSKKKKKQSAAISDVSRSNETNTRQFRQNEVKVRDGPVKENGKAQGEVHRVLSKIF